MEHAVARQSFDGGDLAALRHNGERHARERAPPVEVHRAGAAFAPIATFLGAGQADPLAQRVEQCHARVEARQPVLGAVDAQDQIDGCSGLLHDCRLSPGAGGW